VGDDVVIKCISNFKNKAALGTQKGTNFGLKCVRMRLAAGLHPDTLDPLAAIGGGVPTSKGEGREWGRERGLAMYAFPKITNYHYTVCRILIQNEQLKQVDTFPYLGSLVTEGGECTTEFRTRLNRG